MYRMAKLCFAGMVVTAGLLSSVTASAAPFTKLAPSVPLSGGASVIKNDGSGLCMTSGGEPSGNKAQQYTCNSSNNQSWHTINTYELENNGVVANQCLDNYLDTGNNNAAQYLFPCQNAANQKYGVIPYSGPYDIIEDDQGLCLTSGGNKNNGSPILQYSCNGSPNQLWLVTSNG